VWCEQAERALKAIIELEIGRVFPNADDPRKYWESTALGFLLHPDADNVHWRVVKTVPGRGAARQTSCCSTPSAFLLASVCTWRWIGPQRYLPTGCVTSRSGEGRVAAAADLGGGHRVNAATPS
jgi:hypothetical protein